MLRTAIDSLLSVIYPQECRICRNSVENFEDGVVCSICWDDAKFFSTVDTLCAKCGAFLSDRPSNIAASCKQCTDHAYDSASAVGIYRGPIAASVIHLKTHPEISKRLSNAFASASAKLDVSDRTLIIPVPLSKLRTRERGFNQALVLAEIASKTLDCHIDSASLSRITHTAMHRAAMDRKARDKTVKNAFKVERPKLIEGRDIILVDDVLTSGATASHCAAVLKKSGAASVRVLTLARAV
jgi:ComF family protein